MKHLLSTALLAATLTFGAATQAAAQSDILLRLRSGSPAGDRFRVDSASGVVAKGFLGIGIIPQTGAGERMMWHPFKAAFRVGGVDLDQWDDGNVGFYTLASGYNSVASGNYSIAAGYNARAAQAYGVSLGYTTNSDGAGAVALGYRSTANANYAVAIGQRASANGYSGAIVISDASSSDSLQASANNQFSLRASGGIRMYTNATKTVGVSISAGGSSWSVISDRNRKEGFLSIDGEDMLSRIRAVPVSTWRYIDEEDRTVRHIGPMAQDWQRAFGFNADGTTINMSDFDGVNLAGIQALERRTAELQAQVAERDARIESLEARIARLEALLAPPAAPAP